MGQSPIFNQFKREWGLVLRQPSVFLEPWFLYLICSSILPLSMNPSPDHLRALGPGMIWISVLLSTILSLDRLFRAEFEWGALETWLLLPEGFLPLLYVKLIVHWLVITGPMILLTPVLSAALGFSASTVPALFFALLLGTPFLHLLGALVAALTLGLRQAGLLASVLLLPLYIPVLIFASGAVLAAGGGQNPWPGLAILAAMSLFALVFAPLAIGSALRLAAQH